MDRDKFLNHALIGAYAFFTYFSYFIYSIHLAGLGMAGGRIGVLLMLYTATAIFGSFFVGLLEDRFGARGNTVAGLALTCVFYLGLAFCRGFAALVLLFLVGGLGNNIVRVTMNALFFKTHDRSRQGRAIGVYNLLTQFAMGCGIIAGSLLLARLDFRAVFLLSAAFSLALTGCAVLLRPVTVRIEPLGRYARDLASRRVLLFAAAILLFCLHWGAEIACYAPFLETDLRLGTAEAGIFMGVPIIFLACCSYWFGTRRDRGASTLRLALGAIALSGAGLIAFGAARNTVPAFLFRLVHEAGDAGFAVFSYLGIARLFPRARLGGASGLIYLLMVGSQSAGALVFGWAGGRFGFSAAYLAAGACSLAAIPLILLARDDYRYATEEPCASPYTNPRRCAILRS